MVLKVKNGFDQMSDANLEVKAQTIVAAMTNNPHFTTPVPALADMQTAINAFSAALSKAKEGGTMEVATKDQKRSELITLLHSLGNYVLFTANGDRLIATSSAFGISKETNTPAPPVGTPGNTVLKDGGNKGELELSFSRVASARSYLYQYTQEPLAENSNWQTVTGTTKKVVLKNLQSGKRYWCRVAAIGINNQIMYGEPVSRIVQ